MVKAMPTARATTASHGVAEQTRWRQREVRFGAWVGSALIVTHRSANFLEAYPLYGKRR